ncbi:ribonuclease E inhibitor RraB [Arcticibacterium luteifluviistationis]|nr:ribonuclease E inhibitor RraB [Arcticibacterium luteifluviistationis]
MIKNLLIILLLTLMTSCESKSQNNMIPKEEIVGFFDRMKSNGVDTNTKMLYGYFFTNDEPKKLEIVAEELKKTRI